MQRLVIVCASLMLLLAGCKTTPSSPEPPASPAPKPQAITESPAQPHTMPADTYTTYVNSRRGFTVEYPRSFKLKPPPENGDGREFYDGQGFTMVAYGSNNALEHTLAVEMQERKGDFDKITYSAKGKNWFVLSGLKGSNILYEKTYIGKGSIHGVEFEYPSSAKAKYDPVVTHISNSFKPGNVDEWQ